MRLRTVPLPAAVLALAVVVAACGSDNNKTSSSSSGPSTTAAGAKDNATLTGAGSTFVNNIVVEWIKQYKAAAPGVSINYQPVGSGAGITQLKDNPSTDFAGSDVPLTADQQAGLGGPSATATVPWSAGGIAVEYNLPSVKDLKLSPEALAGIFAGKITKWDAPEIKTDNPGVPSTAIQVDHRSDGSGTTQVLTGFLAANAPSTWTYGSGKDWTSPAGTGSKGSDGVTNAVKGGEGHIGYAEVSFAKTAGLGVALVKNAAGQFTGPTSQSANAALASAKANPDNTIALDFKAPANDAYPISTVTYVIYRVPGSDAGKTAALKHFVQWALTAGQSYAASLDYAPLPNSIASPALNSVKT
jgi:phosphate transport system substrate-binding protein